MVDQELLTNSSRRRLLSWTGELLRLCRSMYQEDTIAAVATPPGEGGLAVVRISGPDAEKIALQIFNRRQSRNGSLRSHTLYHGEITDPKEGQPIDEVLLTLMRKPRSYTGEDVVEVHCHGGNFLVREILATILNQGARQAEPGEFTKRAFLNGRVDLAQAEAVLDLIRAKTAKGAQLALNQASGELSKHTTLDAEFILDDEVGRIVRQLWIVTGRRVHVRRHQIRPFD